MLATVNVIRNPFHPTLDRDQVALRRRQSIKTISTRQKIDFNRPVIVYFNGAPLLRKDWRTTKVKDGDVVSFIYLPQGGGGSNPLRLILTIAMMAFAPILAASLGTQLGITSTIGMSLLKIGVGMLGQALVNAIVPPPKPPKSQQQAQQAAPSPTYSLNAQGNQARIGQPVPVVYGQMRIFPDFAAQPYTEYSNNEQYLYQLFCIGQGRHTLDPAEIRVEDSPITSFTGDYEVEVVQPGQISQLYPKQVYNVSEVSGQELIADIFGPFPVNPSDTQVNKLSFDVVLPRGLAYINDEGGYASRTVTFRFFARQITDQGNPVGAEFTLGSETITAATPTAIRRTYDYTVAAGRYQVTMQRTSPKDNNQRTLNDLLWTGARGYAVVDSSYGDKTLLAIKFRASNTLSQTSSRKISVLVVRQLSQPTYNVSTQTVSWGIEQQTRSIAWAIADMCRAQYGAGVTEARFNVQQLIQLHQFWETRGDTLNCVFDSSQTFWEALTIACRAGRVRPYIQGGMIHFFRDGLRTMPTALFSSLNMVKDSLRISYVMSSEDNTDAIDVEYLDETLWKTRTVRAKLEDSAATKPIKIQAFGITGRDQSFREGMYMAAANRYRRKEISFDTELEGHIPTLGDLIAIQSDIPEWGQSSWVIDYSTGHIHTADPMTWTEGSSHFMLLRSKAGSASAPISVVRGDTDHDILFVDTDVTFPITFDETAEPTHVVFGRAGNVTQLALVLGIVPRGDTVTITSVNEDARVHAADGTPVPLDIFEWSLPSPTARPVLKDLTVTQTGSGTTPSVMVSWSAVSGASRYIVEISYDDENWSTVGDVLTTSFTFLASHGTLHVRVAAFGGVLGPYQNRTITLGEVAPPADVVAGTINSNGQSFDVSWTEVTDADSYFVEVFRLGDLKRSFNTVSTTYNYSLDSAIADGGPWRSITIKVRAQKGNVKSVNPFELNGTNPSPTAPTLLLSPSQVGVGITVSTSLDADYAGTVIHADTTQNFTPSLSNRIYRGNANFYSHVTTQPLYYKAAHFDTYGETGLNYSSEYSAQPSANPSGITVVSSLPTTGSEGDVVYLTTDDQIYTHDGSQWNVAGSGEVPDNSITSAKLVAGSVIASKISVGTLGAVSANLGTINSGNITLDPSSFIRGGQTAYGIGTGYFIGYYLGDYVMSVGNSTRGFSWANGAFTIKGDLVAGSININNKFLVDQNGNVTIRSALTGARVEQTNEVIKVYDDNNILRVKLGNLLA